VLNKENSYIGFLDSPLGILKLTASTEGLTSVSVVEERGAAIENDHILFHKKQLKSYFETGDSLEAKYLDLSEHSEFDRTVWKALTEIPFGKTKSYKDLSIAINNPKAVRAVGTANGRNPILIIVPCHRVIGSNGSLTGFSAGLEKKRKLLMHENVLPQELF